MKLILLSGVIISTLGLIGLLTCIQKGIKIKRSERSGAHTLDELTNRLNSLYVLNMVSLSFSFIGLLLVVLGIIMTT